MKLPSSLSAASQINLSIGLFQRFSNSSLDLSTSDQQNFWYLTSASAKSRLTPSGDETTLRAVTKHPRAAACLSENWNWKLPW